MSTLHLDDDRIRYADYGDLQEVFWTTFCLEVGGLDKETKVVKTAAIAGLLLSPGFTSCLANTPEPVPIRDDESSPYDMVVLDSLLINPAAKISGFAG